MGCCHSTAHSTNSSSTPYLPHQPHTASSSRAIAQQQQPGRTSTPSLRTSSHTPTLAHPSSRRHLPAHEHFNAPLRPHKPSATSPSSRHAPAPRTWTPSQLRKEREEFFETRVTGRSEIWGSLKLCCESLWEGDVATAQGILDAVGVTVPTGDLVQGAYDEMGGLYVLPAWVVAEPEVVVDELGEEGKELVVEENTTGEKGKEIAAEGGRGIEGMVRVRARLSDRGGPDVVVLMGKEDSVGVVARRVMEQAKLPLQSRIKIAYLGKIFKEGESLQAQGWREGHVVNALVFQ
ncbi:MAG: hypothetical protein LQ337_008142 [Flavoplaca oasis]|nr:MAG: hypothetical protein LQ337_008142 [Flavoplaca oasis]